MKPLQHRLPRLRLTLTLSSIFNLPGCAAYAVVDLGVTVYSRIFTDGRIVEIALTKFSDYMEYMQCNDAADMFEANGSLAESNRRTLESREEIRQSLCRPTVAKVLSYKMHADETLVENQTAKQRGTFSQSLVISNGETLAKDGVFSAEWSRQADKRWLVKRMSLQLINQ
jgi:hypothetical protein